MGAERENRPLRIAIVLDKFLPARGGERYFSFLAEELAKRGHEVHVFATEAEQTAAAPYKIHLVPVIAKPRSLRILSFMAASSWRLRNYDFDIVQGEALSTAINVYNPHGGAEKAYLRQEFASIRNRPYRILRFLKRYLSLRHYLEVWVQAWLFKSSRVKKIIAVSDMVKRDIMRCYGIEGEKISVVFDSVDLARFRPDNKERYRKETRDVHHLTDQEKVLLFVSNNYRLKGLYTLLAGMVRLTNRRSDLSIHLLVAGRGDIARYGHLTEKLRISGSVRFCGPVAGIERYYAASDVFVHPTFYDSCAMTILEALATGVPVVTTRFAGAARAVTDGVTGFVLDDPSDFAGLADAIERCLEPGFLPDAAAEARKAAEMFSPDYNLNETLRTYREVLGIGGDRG